MQFSYMDNSGNCPIAPPGERALGNENWKDATAFMGLGVDTSMARAIFSSLQSLYSVNWHPSWNDESMLGLPIPYAKSGNQNFCITPSYGPPAYLTSNGFQWELDQALPWNPSTRTWNPPVMTISSASSCGAIDECLFQSVNLYIRGDLSGAQSNLQKIASQCAVNSDGSVRFGPSPARGMYLSTFLEAYEVINSPSIHLTGGCSISAIVSTVYCLQQSDGSIARNYSSCSSTAGGDDETTNAFLLAASPGVITFIQSESSAHTYSTSYIPPNQPVIGI